MRHVKSKELKVKSFYLPSEGLQGQRFPLHVIWEGNEWDEFSVRIPRRIRFHSIFNVRSWTRGRRALKFKRSAFNVPGYVGMVLESATARKDSHYKSSVRVVFRRKGKPIFDEKRDIDLFRPEVRLGKMPTEIRISERKHVNQKVSLEVHGMGTLWLFVEAAPFSQVRTRLPDEVRLAYKELGEELMKGFRIAAEQFPEYSEFFEMVMNSDSSNREELQRLQKEVDSKVQTDRELMAIILRVFIVAQSRTTRMQTAVIKPILDISRSTLARGVLLVNPFMVLKIPSQTSVLRFVIRGQNLLGTTVSKIITPEIRLVVDGEIPTLPVSSILRITTTDSEGGDV